MLGSAPPLGVPSSLDEGYLGRVEQRTNFLERKSHETNAALLETKRDLTRTMEEVRADLDELTIGLRDAEQEVAITVAAIKEAVARFTSAARSVEVERLRARIDAWAPERRITREQFLRLLEDSI